MSSGLCNVENQVSPQPTPPPAPAAPPPNAVDSSVVTISRTTVNLVITAAVFLVIGMIIGSILYERGSSDEALIRRIANAVFETNRAELQSMIASAVGNSAGTAVDPNRVYAVTTEGPALGAQEPLVTIVAFEDFQCGYCKRFRDQTLPQIIQTYGDRVRFVYRDYPILGPASVDSALAGACAHDQGRFWEFHDHFYADQSLLTRENFIARATELDMDVETFTTCYDTRQHEPTIVEDLVEGQQLGITGTPTFFVNGKILIGARPYTDFVAMIEAELAAASAAQGTS